MSDILELQKTRKNYYYRLSRKKWVCDGVKISFDSNVVIN